MKSLLDLARSRVSVRSFTCVKVDIKDVLYAIDVAHHAPSGANRQPWRFIIIRDDKLKARIRELCVSIEKEFHEKAPE